jgi:hypothetical protein
MYICVHPPTKSTTVPDSYILQLRVIVNGFLPLKYMHVHDRLKPVNRKIVTSELGFGVIELNFRRQRV